MSSLPVCECCGQVIKPPPKKRSWAPGEDALLKEKRASGWKNDAIAELLKRPTSSINSRLDTLKRHASNGYKVQVGDADGQQADDALLADDDGDDRPAQTVEVRPGVRIVRHRVL